MPNFSGINQIGSVGIHTCRRDSDRSMTGPRQITSAAGRLRMLDFARMLSEFGSAYRIAPRSAADRSHPFGVRRAQRITCTFAQRTKSEGLGFKSLVQRHPRHRLFIFAGESLRRNVAIILSSHWCCCRSLPLGVRVVGRYVFVLDDLEDMDITHFLQVVRSEVCVTAESSI